MTLPASHPSKRHGKDGRRIIDPPCSYGHTRQSMECPSCAERVTGEPASVEWVAWYRKRYAR